jgi:hypothetical protein
MRLMATEISNWIVSVLILFRVAGTVHCVGYFYVMLWYVSLGVVEVVFNMLLHIGRGHETYFSLSALFVIKVGIPAQIFRERQGIMMFQVNIAI